MYLWRIKSEVKREKKKKKSEVNFVNSRLVLSFQTYGFLIDCF